MLTFLWWVLSVVCFVWGVLMHEVPELRGDSYIMLALGLMAFINNLACDGKGKKDV